MHGTGPGRPAGCDILTAHLARARRPGRDAAGRGVSCGADTAGTAAAGHRVAERGSRRAVGLRPKDAEKAAAPQRRDPQGWHRAVAADRAARYVSVCLRVLQAPYALGAHADHVVAVARRVAGGLDPGNPCIPGPVSFGAQQVADRAAGHLHDGRRQGVRTYSSPSCAATRS